MKESKVDELFEHKLRNLDKTPSPEAWNKIHANLNQNKNGFIIWKVAAGILLFAGLVFLIYQLSPTERSESITDKNLINQENNDLNKTNEQPITEQEQIIAHNDGLNGKKTLESSERSNENTRKTDDSQSMATKIASNNESVYKEKSSEPIEPTKALAVISSEKQMIPDDQVKPVDSLSSSELQHSLAVAESEKEHPVITITYKKGPRAQANSNIAQNDTKDHAFKKLISYAKDIKNGEIGLSDIRNAKDELLAVELNLKKINFSKEKN